MFKKILLTMASTIALSTAAYAEDSGNPEEIIVTARNRVETLADTPSAITVINSDFLENKKSTNVGDLSGAVPGLIVSKQQGAGGNAANISLRGLGFADVEKSFDPTVGVIVDGVQLGTSSGQFFDTFDLENVEVFRGPQGVMFGRNTIGGVIKINRTKPTGTFGVKGEVAYGNYNALTTRTVVNLPKLSNLISTKLFYFHEESAGWARNGETGKRVNGFNNENFGASFLIQPEGSNFNALLTVEKQIQDWNLYTSSLTQSSDAFCAAMPTNQCNRNNTTDLYTVWSGPINTANGEPRSYYSSPAATLEMNYQLGKVKLTSITGYRDIKEIQEQDVVGSSTGLYIVSRTQNYRQISQELRLTSTITNNADVVFGGYFFDGRYNQVMNPKIFGSWLGGSPTRENALLSDGGTQSYAVFGDINYAITDQLRVNAGGRWTHDKKWQYQYFFGLLGDETANFSKFTPRVSVDYSINDDNMVYASWSQGYRSGGFSQRAQTPYSASTPFGPETVNSFEVGTKSSLFNDRVFLSLAGFLSKYKDMQQVTTRSAGPTGQEAVVQNVASSTIKGVEGELVIRPDNNFTFTGAASYIDGSFENFNVQMPNIRLSPLLDNYDYTALPMILSPKFTGSVSANYSRDTNIGKLNLQLAYRYIGKHTQQLAPGLSTLVSTNSNGTGNYKVLSSNPVVVAPEQHLVDASISTTFNRAGTDFTLTLYGRNLTDDRGPALSQAVAGLWSLAWPKEPRTYGISLGVKF